MFGVGERAPLSAGALAHGMMSPVRRMTASGVGGRYFRALCECAVLK